MNSILFVYELMFLSLIGLFDEADLQYQQIDKDNIADGCHLFNASLCLFLNMVDDRQIVLTPNESVCAGAMNKNEPCIRLNVKRLDDPCRHEFQVAGINVVENAYIGIGLSKDNQMLADFGFYCTREKALVGLIIRRFSKDSEIVFDTQFNWRDNPDIIQASHEKTSQSLYFIRCGFKTHNSHYLGGRITDHPSFEVALGKTSLVILMSLGEKKSKDDNLIGLDKHTRKGYFRITDQLISPEPEKCGRKSKQGRFLVSFYWFLLLIVYSTFSVREF